MVKMLKQKRECSVIFLETHDYPSFSLQSANDKN